ncbi:MAG: glycoside hydrolase family 57 protein [Paludibacteraceae bacterium]|nr:glycoside hydrolase family 57 protein [Paludibacteraceae bacterium]
MKNICFCFQMHVPYRLKRYRFFEIGHDHYYYDDMATEEHVNWLVQTSYLPLCQTIKDMINLSKGKFHCALSVSGTMIEMFEQFNPEMIDILKELAASKCVEFLATPYSYSLASEYNESEMKKQFKKQEELLESIFGVKAQTVWNTELLYTDETAYNLYKLGYKTILTEGAKHILSWNSPNCVYQSAGAPKMKVLLRNSNLSDELSFHFSDPGWGNFPIDAEKYANQLKSFPEGDEIINIWVGADTFGVRQNVGSGIFEFLKALPYYVLEREMGFMTPAEAAKKLSANNTVSAPYALTWSGEAKDLSVYVGNDLQQEAINKLFAVAERVHLCQDKSLKTNWLRLQDVNYLHYMNHIDQGETPYESAYDAFINYMNVLSDFLQTVEEQYPTTIENEELNELLKTIRNQEEEIQKLQEKLKSNKSEGRKAKS